MTIRNANLLLLSSSRVGETQYLAHALDMIKNKLNGITELLFIPYAGVTMSYDEYTEKVQRALTTIGVNVTGIHEFSDPVAAINSAQAIAVGGGNTFHLLHQLYENNLISAIEHKVADGMPYIGWSAGSNIAGLSIRTTNDMPIIEPKSFTALSLVNFQLNPHYTDYNPAGHNGETRAQRLAEFMVIDPLTPIVAIVEGSALDVNSENLKLVVSCDVDQNSGFSGEHAGYIFKGGVKSPISSDDDLSYLL